MERETTEFEKALAAFEAAQGAPREYSPFKILAGEWDYQVDFRIHGKGEHLSSWGELHADRIIGGNYLQIRINCLVEARKYQSFALLGIDAIRNVTHMAWVDNLLPYMAAYIGRYIPEECVLRLEADVGSPILQRVHQLRFEADLSDPRRPSLSWARRDTPEDDWVVQARASLTPKA